MSRSNRSDRDSGIPSPETSNDETPPKEIYDATVGAVEHNTGGKQPPLSRKAPIIGNVSRRGYHPDDVNRAITAACANGDLFRWTDDREDPPRTYLGVDTVEHLRWAIAKHVELRDDPNRDLIGVANQRIAALADPSDS